MTAITDRLGDLLDTITSQGYDLSRDLNPGLDRSEILSLANFFPCALAEELIELYQWRNGQIMGEWFDNGINVSGIPLFRDNYFIPLHRTKEYYLIMLDIMEEEEDWEFLRYAFPFATYEGSIWVMCCGAQPLQPQLKHPIVSIFEGIEVYFCDMLSMLDTIIAWYREGAYRIRPDRRGNYAPLLDYNERLERQIWQRLNPDIMIW
ncbi:MAG: hypothetical protein RMK91_05875 [Pseudanabaenaceae cyanobacterium SKYGB_i_bin29]|nr:hypothetical protein [Pseudanabaenaceae cyanobacterium SKYG29]MDW8421379.1 hypothetical protein [Pseudanabaenaceae cyanobacterium SKYGB_i_bin29]